MHSDAQQIQHMRLGKSGCPYSLGMHIFRTFLELLFWMLSLEYEVEAKSRKNFSSEC